MYFTTNHSMYIVDEKNKTIVGGFFKEETLYQKISPIFIGDNVSIKLLDGRIVKTSPVVSIKKSVDNLSLQELKTEFLKYEKEDMNFHDNFGCAIYEAFQTPGNSFQEIANTVIKVIQGCNTDKEYQIADNMIVALTGHTITNLLYQYEQIRERDIENEM